MNVAFWLREDQCIKNNIFSNPLDATGAKAHLKYQHLFKFLKDRNINLTTFDLINNYDSLDAAIFVDYPLVPSKKAVEIFNLDIPKILITDENRYLRPKTWTKKNLNSFDFIFCNDDEYVDNKKFFKHHVHDHFKDLNLNFKILKKEFKNKKFLSMISWNKKYSHPATNYDKRIKVIEWFEKHHSNEFDLFGTNWDEFIFPWDLPLFRRLNTKRFRPLRKIFAKKYSTWTGKVSNKADCIKNYKFVFVFENTDSINGYITEKIFDVFYGGSIPIYLGAKNIKEYINDKCFINLREYENLEDLYKHLNLIDDLKYQEMLSEVEKFLYSKESYSFTTKYLCEKIYTTLLKI